MSEITLTLQHQVGLHARPAALFVQTAQRFKSDILVFCCGRESNAKSMLGVLGLGAGKGAEITIKAEGEDADEALNALQTLIANNFGE
jgi:phosphotransferase system HPr (HPr) family protein